MTATNINLNELANEIYLENAIAYKGITKEEFTNYFINKMEGVTLSTTMVVHAVAFCTREYEQVRKEIELLKNN